MTASLTTLCDEAEGRDFMLCIATDNEKRAYHYGLEMKLLGMETNHITFKDDV
jgi:hypothetical protein